MKKLFLITSLLTFALISTAPVLATMSDPDFTVRVVATPESIDGKDTLAVDWRIIANTNDLHLRFGSGLRLAYDYTVLELVRFSGADSNYTITEELAGMVGAGSLGVYEGAYFDVRACRNSDSSFGYVTIELGHPELSYQCTVNNEETLASIRFEYREGKSQADLNSSSIRLMTSTELERLQQSKSVNIFTVSVEAETYFEYVYRARNDEDSLNAPELVLQLDTEIKSVMDDNTSPEVLPGIDTGFVDFPTDSNVDNLQNPPEIDTEGNGNSVENPDINQSQNDQNDSNNKGAEDSNNTTSPENNDSLSKQYIEDEKTSGIVAVTITLIVLSGASAIAYTFNVRRKSHTKPKPNDGNENEDHTEWNE